MNEYEVTFSQNGLKSTSTEASKQIQHHNYEEVKTAQENSSHLPSEGIYENFSVIQKSQEKSKCNKVIAGVDKLIIGLLSITIFGAAVATLAVEINNVKNINNELTITITEQKTAITALKQYQKKQKKEAEKQYQTIIQLKQSAEKQNQTIKQLKHSMENRNQAFESLVQRLDNNNKSLENVEKQVKDITAGFVRLDGGWVTPLNGFQYKYYSNWYTTTWSRARSICQNLGGDVASYGMQSFAIRRFVIDELSITYNFWIGLNHQYNEWRWDTNVITHNRSFPGINATNFFAPGRPNSSRNECVVVSTWNWLSYDVSCWSRYGVLCEKQYS